MSIIHDPYLRHMSQEVFSVVYLGGEREMFLNTPETALLFP